MPFDAAATVAYNEVTACLVWADELPEGLSRDGYEVVRDLLAARGLIHRGIPIEDGTTAGPSAASVERGARARAALEWLPADRADRGAARRCLAATSDPSCDPSARRGARRLRGGALGRALGRAGIAVSKDDDGGRRLVSVLDRALDVADPRPAERLPWTCRSWACARRPAAVRSCRGPSRWRSVDRSIPPSWDETEADVAPPFAIELARRMAVAGDAGVPVGPLHPALVFVTQTGELAATAQRVLRLAPAAPPEGRPPLFAASYRTPAEVRGEPASAPDDAFRLASLLWRWRHGAAPFGTGLTEVEGILADGPPTSPATPSTGCSAVRSPPPRRRDERRSPRRSRIRRSADASSRYGPNSASST